MFSLMATTHIQYREISCLVIGHNIMTSHIFQPSPQPPLHETASSAPGDLAVVVWCLIMPSRPIGIIVNVSSKKKKMEYERPL